MHAKWDPDSEVHNRAPPVATTGLWPGHRQGLILHRILQAAQESGGAVLTAAVAAALTADCVDAAPPTRDHHRYLYRN